MLSTTSREGGESLNTLSYSKDTYNAYIPPNISHTPADYINFSESWNLINETNLKISRMRLNPIRGQFQRTAAGHNSLRVTTNAMGKSLF
jgi:hypothetical protein